MCQWKKALKSVNELAKKMTQWNKKDDVCLLNVVE